MTSQFRNFTTSSDTIRHTRDIYQETLQSRTVCGSRLRKNYRCDIFPKKERNYTDERTNGVSSSDMLLTWTRAGGA